MKTRGWIGTAVMTLMLLLLVPLWLSARAHGPTVSLELATAEPELERFAQALAVGDRSVAVHALQDAWSAALASRRWEPMLAVGDAALRLADDRPSLRPAQARARQAFKTALFRAQAAGSQEGMLRAADAFAALGDRDVADAARRMAAAVTR